MSRGNRKASVFGDDRDRHRFLRILGLALERYGALCFGYSLMGNHYHLVVSTPRGNISAVMRHLNGLYTQYANWRHGWTGHVFEARFRSILIGDDDYFRNALRYLARNPVEAGLVRDPEHWQWSSYRAVIGRTKARSFLKVDWLQAMFPAPSQQASRQLFKQFVSQSSDNFADEIVKGQASVHRAVRVVVGATLYQREVPRSYRALGRPPLGMLFNGTCRRDRRRLIMRAHVVHGYRMTEIARHLDLHPTTISRLVNTSGSYKKANSNE